MPLRSAAAAPLVLLLLSAAACGHDADQGHQLYTEHGCAVCHGPSGRGDGPTAHTLTPPPHDFAAPHAYLRGASAAAIAASIQNGVGNMPAFHDLSDEDARKMAAWIVTLQHAGEAR